ncbi:MAG: DUF1492 domain-containing protein, partial [Eubacterium sp.]
MTPEQRRRNAMAPVVVRGGTSITLEDIISEMDALDREIQAKIYKAMVLRRDIGQAIDDLEDDREKLVLYYKYVDGMYLEEICGKIHCSYRQIKTIHARAIKNLKTAPNCP